MQFDYIIVGAGSAGCVLANRLTANGKHSVCLIEAGPKDSTSMISIPGAFPYFMFSKKYNWAYNSQTHDDIRHGQPLFCPRGKTLGGSSAVNAMLYIRGHRSDYDHWQSLGNEGWSYDHMLPYFIKAETNERGASELHGDSGPLYVSDCRPQYAMTQTFLDGAQQAGYPFTDDFNGEQFEGVGLYQATIRDGVRCGTSRGYLHPAKSRQNLTIFTDAVVTKINIQNKQATGITVRLAGQETTISANKEVILSAGAFNSPQVLMLSGVGDEVELRQQGITATHHLPGVGKNLQEHVDACVLVNSKKRDGFTLTATGLAKLIPDVVNYFTKKQGRLAVSMAEGGAFLKSSEGVEVPDIQLHFAPLLFDDCGRDFALMRKHGCSLHVCVLRPESRGTVTLANADPTADPIIEFNFLTTEQDKKVLVDGLRVARKILESEAFSPYYESELHPGIDAQSDEALLQKAKDRLGLVYHPVGTCKMGNDDMAVVDSHLRVHGIEHLRVVDASIMPTLISGNTNAPTVAIAEKAADMILSDA